MDNIQINPFEQLETFEDLPRNHKNRVISSINLIALVKDITELFTTNASKTALHLLSAENEIKKDNRSDPTNKNES